MTESGRKEIVQQQKDLPENTKVIAGSTATGGLILGSGLVGLLDENGSVKDATTLTKNNANAAYDAELAAKLQLIQEGKLDNLVDNQDILNQYNQGLIKGTSNQNTQVNLNADLYNAAGTKVDATTNITNKTDIYLDRNAQNNSVGLITHENAHQQGFGEGSSNALGKLGETAFNVNSWVNSKNIDVAKTQIQTAPKIETSGKNDAQAQLDLLKTNEQKQLGQIINGDKFEDHLSATDNIDYHKLKGQFEKQCSGKQSVDCSNLAKKILVFVNKGSTIIKSETNYMSEDIEFGGGEKTVVTRKPNDLVACIISSSSVCMVTNKLSNGEYVLQPANKQQVEQYNKQKKANEKYVTELGQQAYLAGCTSVGISAFVCQVYHAAGQPYPLTGKTPTNDERVLLAAGATAQVVGGTAGVIIAAKNSVRPQFTINSLGLKVIKIDSTPLEAQKRLNVKDEGGNGQKKPAEAAMGAQLESVLGAMEKYQVEAGAAKSKTPDWKITSGPYKGKTVDAMYTTDNLTQKEINGLNKYYLNSFQKGSAQRNIQDHLVKADFVPIDFRVLNQANQKIFLDYIKTLPKSQQAMILAI